MSWVARRESPDRFLLIFLALKRLNSYFYILTRRNRLCFADSRFEGQEIAARFFVWEY